MARDPLAETLVLLRDVRLHLFKQAQALPRDASMPSSVTIPAGQSTAGFTMQTWTTGTTPPVNFTASYNGVAKSTVMNVHAPSENVPISSVSLSQPSIVGGSNQAVQAVIRLAANAPREGATIMLGSSRPDIVPLPRSTRIFFSTQNTAPSS